MLTRGIGILLRTPCLFVLALVGCAPPPPEPRHRCVVIPNGLVECHEVAPIPR
jgi:hypothetical protein